MIEAIVNRFNKDEPTNVSAVTSLLPEKPKPPLEKMFDLSSVLATAPELSNEETQNKIEQMVRSTLDGKLDKFGIISPKKDLNRDEEFKKINTVLE